MDHQVVATPLHRATYTLERGVWSATCRTCGFTVKDINRSRAATWFLTHIRAVRLQRRADEAELRAAKAWERDDIYKQGPAPGPTLKTRAGGTEDEIELRGTAADGGQ